MAILNRVAPSLMLLAALGLLAPPLGWAQSATKPAAEPVAEDAEEKPRETAPVMLPEGELTFAAPTDWKRVKPRNRIIEAELSIPGKEKDDPAARLTVMPAGGGIKANLARWQTQFRPGGSGPVEPEVKQEKLDGMPLTWFDATGAYLDSPRGPFGPKVEKPGYRMIAAILQTKDSGNYFFKLVGPADLLKREAKSFRKMVLSVQKATGAETTAAAEEKAGAE